MKAPLAAMVLCLAVLGCQHQEFEESFPTYSAAKAAAPLLDNFAPPYIPPSATNIRVWHHGDTDAARGHFHFGIEDSPSFRAALGPPEEWPSGPSADRPAWWPAPLSGSLKSKEARGPWELHTVAVPGRLNWVIAVDWQAQEAYFWSQHS